MLMKKTITCAWCGATVEKTFSNYPAPRFCDRSCSARWRMSRPEYVATLNTEKLRATSRANMHKLRQRPDVQAKLAGHLSGPGNPFNDPAVQAKARVAARESGYPGLTGGNGRGLTVPQALLAARLGWATEHVVPTDRPRPTHYKIDVASPELMIAIEVDGESHNSRAVKARDARKNAFLVNLGWTVLRFRNKRVLAETDAVLAEILAVVRSTTSKQGPETS
jgi:Protein of unknown function (DUF559)